LLNAAEIIYDGTGSTERVKRRQFAHRGY
jgi:hypothetical protein